MDPLIRFFRSPFTRLTLYYLFLSVAAYALLSRFEVLRGAFSLERLNAPGGGFGSDLTSVSEAALDPVGSAVTAVFAIVGGLTLLAPVAWVYMITKQREGYDVSVVHTVIILPVAVTGLVIVVHNNIALAFSLAGIVAAVRFRNTLKDTRDAVYIFLAIGTALAAGVQALGIAAVTSLMFNYVVLFMWHLRIGNIYADQRGRTPKMRLGDVLAGAGSEGAGTGSLTIGDPELLAALTPDDLSELAERKSRFHERVSGSLKSRKYNGVLIVHAAADEDTLAEVEGVLGDYTKSFELTEVSSGSEGLSTIEYLVELAKDTPASSLVSNLRSRVADKIAAAEFRVLAGTKEKAKKK